MAGSSAGTGVGPLALTAAGVAAGFVVAAAAVSAPLLLEGFPFSQLLRWPGQLLKYGLGGAQVLLDALPEDVRSYVTGSLFVSVPISIVGTVGAIAYRLYSISFERLRQILDKHFQVTMMFKSSDKHYDIILDYIGSRCCIETGKIVASTKPRHKPSFQEMLASWLGGKMKAPNLYYQPDIQGFGSFFYWTDEEGMQHKIWLSHHVEKPQFRSDSGKERRDPETISLTMWWTTDSTVLKNFLATGLRTMLKDDSEGTVDIYVKHMWLAMWTKAISRERRDRDTVILDEGLADYIVEDMRHFFSQKTADWYHNAGIPYRRGYLLHGPPGCGKTSFAQVLAGELGLDVCLMNLSNSDMNDDDLAELLRAAPAKSMLLLEDVDAIFVERAAATEKKGRGGGVSFSGLLNALDGAAAQEGCVIMLTTNHKDRLDEALIRPGRCDVHVLVEKASQDQAKRMFWRFFAKEAVVKSSGTPTGTIVTSATHGLCTGDRVKYKRGAGSAMVAFGRELEDQVTFYVRSLDATRLALYDSEAHALEGGNAGLLEATEGRGAKLQERAEAGARFSTRIPEKQVSMAKLQGYLMTQKLFAEREVKKRRDSGELSLCAEDAADEEFKLRQEVHRLASESAIMNVHELLEVKKEVGSMLVTIYDHLRRVGLHRFAPIFEHYGIRFKEDLREDLISRMSKWEPDLQLPGPQLDRLLLLIKGAEQLDQAYDLADLSVLRDRFLTTYQDQGEQAESPRSAPVRPPPLCLDRAVSEPARSEDAGKALLPRLQLLRATSGVREDKGLKLLDMAHFFQERLESNGKTNVSMWQLDMHFQRYAGDPAGALETCARLRHSNADRSPEEREVQWMTTFGFLRRIGLEEYAFKFEDSGYKYWAEWKSLSKEEIKNTGIMSDKDATLCHAVLTGDAERPDLLREFQLPEFTDIVHFFRGRFPDTWPAEARQFAVQLTDELGSTNFSCLQIQAYLRRTKGPKDALEGLRKGLPTIQEAEAARKRPDPPAPPPESTDWVHVWLKGKGLEGHSSAFINQALSTREDVLGAGLDVGILQEMGVSKIGERCKILLMLEEEKKART